MKKYVAGVLLAAILGGGGYYGLVVVPINQLRINLDQAIAKLPPGYSVSYAKARYSLITRTATVEGIKGATTGENPAKVEIATLSVKGPNLGLVDDWNRAAANPSALKPDQAVAVADRVGVQGLSVDAQATTGTVSKISIDEPRLYPWALLHDGVPALSEIVPLYQAMVASEAKGNEDLKRRQTEGQTLSTNDFQAFELRQLQNMLPLLRLQAALILGYGFAEGDADGMSFAVHAPSAASSQPMDISATIRTIHYGAFDRGVGSQLAMDGLIENVGDAGEISIDHMAMGHVSYRDTLARLLNGDPLSMALLDGASLDGAKIEGFAMRMPTGQSAKLQGVSLSNLAFAHGALSSGAFNFSGLKLAKTDLPPTPQGQILFKQLGLDALTINLGASYSWNPDTKAATLRDVTLKIDELGALTLAADLAGIGQGGGIEAQPVTLTGGTLRYDDASLLDRLLSAGGKRSPAQIQQARQAVAGQVELMLAGSSEQKGIPESIKAISAFAANPHSLTITAAPPSPIPVASLKTVSAGGLPGMIATLGLTASANQ